MKNNTTRTLAIVVLMLTAVTLVVGAITAPSTQSAFAYSKNKKGGGEENSRNGNTITALKCENKGSASGFDTATNQECENLICTHPRNNATCVQEGLAVAAVQQGNQTTPPVKLTCEQCLTTILSQGQITTLQNFFSRSSIADLCALLGEEPIPESSFTATLVSLGISPTTASELIACLKDAGIMFF